MMNKPLMKLAQMNNLNNNRPIPLSVASEKTGLSSRRLRELAAAGKLPGAFKPAGPTGHWRIDRQAIISRLPTKK